jgi:hypothetical protein
MPVREPSGTNPKPSRRRPATTPEGRESQMVSMAEELAARQLQEGSASAQVITHYLKLGSTRERLEQQRLAGEVELQKAKIQAMASTERLEAMYIKAMDAFRGYQGKPPLGEDEE